MIISEIFCVVSTVSEEDFAAPHSTSSSFRSAQIVSTKQIQKSAGRSMSSLLLCALLLVLLSVKFVIDCLLALGRVQILNLPEEGDE